MNHDKFKMLVGLYLALFVSMGANAQYEFKKEKRLDVTDVKSQDKTGTCWSYTTASFLESELLRMDKGTHDLSEMYAVRNIYKQKATNYMLRQGKANFSQGALAHDYINAAETHGLMPQSAYSGLGDNDSVHNHSELEAALNGMLESINQSRNISTRWEHAVEGILDAYLGPIPSTFTHNQKEYTPMEFAHDLGFKASDYISLTSFSHHPFHQSFVLEIPDNFSNGAYYNIPLEELVSAVDHALEQGYTVAWDGDVSEKTFSAKNGLALLPKDPKRDDLYEVPGPEIAVDQSTRQNEFMKRKTTDDHLMHLVGLAYDKAGNKYYVIKNSWGAIGPYDGFLYMSEAYFKMKTVGVLFHKSAMQITE